jgi:nucleotide-binding universal stress UspA family protein
MKNRNEMEMVADDMRMNTSETNERDRSEGAKDIKRILVPVDFSDGSVYICLKAGAIAKLSKSELYLIHVVANKGTHFIIVPETKDSSLPVNEIERAAEDLLSELNQSIKNVTGIHSNTFVSEGTIEEEIIKFSKENDIDLIIMGTHGISGYKELFMGSNAQRVVTLSDIPVLTIGKGISSSGFKNILMPFDDSMHSREKVNIAAQFAELFDSEIHILELPETKNESELKEFRIKMETVKELLKEKKIKFKTETISEDNLAQAALDYAEKQGCDLIVINTGHESKLSGFFTQHIINHSKIPVLSIKTTKESYVISTPGYGIS